MDSQITPTIDTLWQIIQQQKALAEEQAAQLTQQSAKLEEQSKQMAALHSRMAEPVGRRLDSRTDLASSRKVSRAGLLKAAAVGVAATTVAAGAELVGVPTRARANGTEGPTSFVGDANSTFAVSATCNGPSGTTIDAVGAGISENPNFRALSGTAHNGIGVNCSSQNGIGLNAQTDFGTAVIGINLGDADNATAILGQMYSTTSGTLSAAVRGENKGTDPNGGAGVAGSHAGYGYGGYFTSVSGIGVLALGGKGTGVRGHGSTGVLGAATANNGIGVQAIGGNGRGIVTDGSRAQLQLAPASAASHPKSDQAGDLFVDSTKRLWFCKGKSAWTRIV